MSRRFESIGAAAALPQLLVRFLRLLRKGVRRKVNFDVQFAGLLRQGLQQLLIAQFRDVSSISFAAQVEHRPQLLVRLQLAVKLRDCSPFAVDRDVLDQLRSLGREVLQQLRPLAHFVESAPHSAAGGGVDLLRPLGGLVDNGLGSRLFSGPTRWSGRDLAFGRFFGGSSNADW